MRDPRTAIGPLARSVDDLALALRVIAGPDFRDPGVVPVAVDDIDSVKMRGLRVATYTDAPGASASAAVVTATRAAATALEAAGAIVEEAVPPRLDESLPITQVYWGRARIGLDRRLAPEGASTLTVEDVERSLHDWDRLRRDVLGFMERFDVIVCPVAADVAPELRDPRDEDFIYTLPYSLTGYPVAVVRAGTSSEGMPVGVQVVARAWCDHVALAAARCVERVCGGWMAAAL
jgi:amidase